MTAGSGLGTPRVHFGRTGSTNEHARGLAARGAPHGTLVTAAEQTAGRGRQGRTWTAPAGLAILCSLVIRDPPRLLPLAAGVAVAELVGPQARVKWPNDVLVDGRKLAGILVEGRPQERWAVLGIGLNVAVREDQFPPELRSRAGPSQAGGSSTWRPAPGWSRPSSYGPARPRWWDWTRARRCSPGLARGSRASPSSPGASRSSAARPSACRSPSRLSMASRSRTCSATSTIRGRRWPSWPGC